MSLLDSLPILLLFVRRSFFDRVTLQLMTSLISFPLFGVRLTLLALSYLLSLVSPEEIKRLHLTFIKPMTFTTTNRHSSHVDPFNNNNRPKLARRYSDHMA
jgi:hypothetical protein